MNMRRMLKRYASHTGTKIAGAIVLLALAGFSLYRSAIPVEFSVPSYADGRDCLPGETYDANTLSCILPCDTEEQCADMDASFLPQYKTLTEDQLKRYFGFEFSNATTTYYDWNAPSLLEWSDAQMAGISDVPHVSYRVESGVLGGIVDEFGGVGESPADRKAWRMFAAVVPAPWKRHIVEFQVVHSPDPAFAGAYMYPLDGSGTRWRFSLERSQLFTPRGVPESTGQLVHTLVHELGHVITLGNRQVEPMRISCSTIAIAEGCVRAGTYLDTYTARFWDHARPENGDARAAYRPDSFTTSYGAENPVEDIAESWSAFVLLPRQNGATTAERKINFFYRYPELVEARVYIREQLLRLP